MAKIKHIKYTKLSSKLSETIPPQWSRHSVARRKIPRVASAGDLCLVVELLELVRWESPPSIYLRLLGNPGGLVMARDSWIRD